MGAQKCIKQLPEPKGETNKNIIVAGDPAPHLQPYADHPNRNVSEEASVSRDTLDLRGQDRRSTVFGPDHRAAHTLPGHKDMLRDTEDMLTTKPAPTNSRSCKPNRAYCFSTLSEHDALKLEIKCKKKKGDKTHK